MAPKIFDEFQSKLRSYLRAIMAGTWERYDADGHDILFTVLQRDYAHLIPHFEQVFNKIILFYTTHPLPTAKDDAIVLARDINDEHS